MSYQRFGTPRIYVDNINWLLALGKMDTDDLTLAGTGISMASGSSLKAIFDLKPSNVQTISCNSSTNDAKINIDTTFGTDSDVDNNFIAILGHNFKDATAKFKIQISDNSNFSSSTTPNPTVVVNGSAASGFVTPPNNGWTLITYSGTSANRYLKITFDDTTGAGFGADIKIGAIMVGEYIDLPQSPDLQLTKRFTFDGLKKNISTGGQTYGNATFLTGANWYLAPFQLGTTSNADPIKKSGRTELDLDFSFLTDTDVFPEKLYSRSDIIAGNDFTTNIISKTHGGLLPMLLQYDNSVTEGQDSFLWCRLNNEPNFQQVAPNVYSTTINLIEEL